MPGCVWAMSASTWSARSKPVVSPVLRRDVADEDLGAGAARTASRIAGMSRLGRRLVNRLPGPEDDQLGVGDRGEGVLGRADAVGRQPDALDAGGPHDLRLAVDDRSRRASRAWSVSGVGDTGTTWPRTARIRLIRRTPSSKSPPSTAVIAAISRLPTA